MKKMKLLTLTFGALLSITSCGGNEIIHNVDQELLDKLPTSAVKIEFWHCLGSEKAKNLEKVIQKFNAKYSGSYYVEADVPGTTTYDSLRDSIITNLSSGRVPALALGYPDNFSEYMTTKLTGSNILRLKNFIEDKRTIQVNQIEYDSVTESWVVKKDAQGNILKEDMLLGFDEEEFENDFIAAYRDEGKNYQFEGYWSLPMYKSTEVMFYNLDYFMGNSDINDTYFNNYPDDDPVIPIPDTDPVEYESVADAYYRLQREVTKAGKYYSANHDKVGTALANLKVHVKKYGGYTYEVPTKWDEMINLSKQMRLDRTAQGYNVDDENFIPVGYDSDSNLMISQMIQRGIPYTTNENVHSRDDHLLFRNDQAKELLREIGKDIDDRLLTTKYTISSTGNVYTNSYFNGGEGAGGRCVMCIGSTGGSSYQLSENFAVEVAPVPYSGTTPKYVQQGPSVCFFDNNNQAIATGAWLFYKMLSDPESNTSLANENDYDPIRYSCEDSEEYKAWIANAKFNLLHHVPEITHLPQVRDNQFFTDVFYGSAACRNEMGNLILRYVHSKNLYNIDTNFDEAYKVARNATRV